MTANKIVTIETVSFLILYVIAIFWMKYGQQPQGDAAGKAMESGYTFLLIMGIFFVAAIVITIVNAFMLNRVTEPQIKFLAFVPMIISLFHGLYTYFFG